MRERGEAEGREKGGTTGMESLGRGQRLKEEGR